MCTKTFTLLFIGLLAVTSIESVYGRMNQQYGGEQGNVEYQHDNYNTYGKGNNYGHKVPENVYQYKENGKSYYKPSTPKFGGYNEYIQQKEYKNKVNDQSEGEGQGEGQGQGQGQGQGKGKGGDGGGGKGEGQSGDKYLGGHDGTAGLFKRAVAYLGGPCSGNEHFCALGYTGYYQCKEYQYVYRDCGAGTRCRSGPEGENLGCDY